MMETTMMTPPTGSVPFTGGQIGPAPVLPAGPAPALSAPLTPGAGTAAGITRPHMNTLEAGKIGFPVGRTGGPTPSVVPDPRTPPAGVAGTLTPEQIALLGANIGTGTGSRSGNSYAGSLPVSIGTRGLQQMERAIVSGSLAIQAEANAARQQAAAESAFREEAVKRELAFNDEIQQNERRRQEQVAQYTTRLDTLVREVGSLRVEPDRFWRNRSSGQKLLAGIGLIFGGAGGNGNRAVDIINQAIQTDIDAQKSNIAVRQNEVTNMRGLLADMRVQFGDERAAELAAKSAYLSYANNRIAAIASQYQAPQIQARAQKAMADLQLEMGKVRQQFELKAADLAVENAKFRIAANQGQSSGGSASGAVDSRTLNAEQLKRFVPNDANNPYVGQLALDEDSAKKARQLNQARFRFSQAMDRLIQWRQKYGAEVTDRQALAQGRALAATVQLQIKEAAALGALDKGAQEYMSRMVPNDPGKFGFVLDGLTTVRDQFEQGARSGLVQFGITPVGGYSQQEREAAFRSREKK